jgi:Mce-associated membrane protein
VIDDTRPYDGALPVIAVPPAQQPSPSEASAGWTPPRWLIPVLAVVLVLLLAGVSLLAVLVNNRSSTDDGRSGALQAARQVASDISSYDYEKADAQFNHLLTISTGEMRTQVQKSIESLVPLIKEGKAKSQGVIRDAAITQVRGDSVTVIAVVDQTATNTAVTKPTLHRYRFVIVMTKVDGRWLVSKLEPA